MDLTAAVAVVIALGGLAVGVGGALAFLVSERAQRRVPEPADPPPLPPGVNTVLSVLSSSAVVLDAEDQVVKASPAGYALGLVRGGRLDAPELLRMVGETRRDGEIRQAELDWPGGARGGPLALSARVAPLGSHLVLVLVEDRTEARRVDAVRRDFVANVSHELKTPVGALTLLAEAVEGASDDPEAVVRFAGRMRVEATRLTSLVQEIIDLSRVQDDEARADERVPVAELVGEAVDRSRQRAAAKDIEIVTSGGADAWLRGDRGQLVGALGNLVENAVSYSPEHTTVRITVRQQGGGTAPVEIAVADQGIGIPPEHRERIFERFYRVDPARSRATGGTGLGLSIVKHVVATHGGEIDLRSADGLGSTFTLRLPAAQPSEVVSP